jgi:hypothetical protein
MRNPLKRDADIQATVTAPVEHAEVNLDLHGSRILLAFQDDLSVISRFSLAPAMARAVGEDMVRRANKADATP